MMRLRSIILLTLGLVLIPVPTSAVCPTNRAGGSSPGGFYEISSSSPTWSSGVVCGDFSLSLPAGTMELAGSGGGGEQSCGPFLSASDLYQVVGPASAVPIPLEVRVHVTGSVTAELRSWPFIGLVCGGAQMNFKLFSGAASTQFVGVNDFQPCAGKSFVTDLVLPLARLPGEQFPVGYDLFISSHGGTGTMRGEVSFANLPAGYSIVSCQGYVGQPVPIVARSWGRLKQAYR